MTVPEEGNLQERCDGCFQPYPAAELSPIGDGSVKVCRECYGKAASLVSTPRSYSRANA